MHVVLNELLRAHYNFLAPVRTAWKAHDEFNNGFLDKAHLEEVIEEVDSDRSFNPQSLVEDIDKEGMDAVTFSALVSYLAEKTTGDNENVSLLQHFYDRSN